LQLRHKFELPWRLSLLDLFPSNHLFEFLWSYNFGCVASILSIVIQNNTSVNLMPVPQYPTRLSQRREAVLSEGLGRIGTTYSPLDRQGHYLRSIDRTGNSRIDLTGRLRNFANSSIVQICIAHIIDGVAAMAFHVKPPKELERDSEALAQCKRIGRIFRRPNKEEQRNYTQLISTIVTDLLIGNIVTIERKFRECDRNIKKDSPNDKDVSLWCVGYDRIEVNQQWTPETEESVPRYFDRGPGLSKDRDKWVPLYDRDMFEIQRYACSWQSRPPSAMEIAMEQVESWLGLNTFQRRTTAKAYHEYLIDLGPVSEPELERFREYYRTQVQRQGEPPIVGTKGSGISVVKLGATDDNGLYLKYEEKMLRLIALCFKLSPRDMNITEPDNRATAGIAADASFAQAILPMAITIFEGFQNEVVDYYYPGYAAELTDTEPRNEEGEASTASSLFAQGILRRNEARRRVGEDPIDGEEGAIFGPVSGAPPTGDPNPMPNPMPSPKPNPMPNPKPNPSPKPKPKPKFR
jgi:hypothetical protein